MFGFLCLVFLYFQVRRDFIREFFTVPTPPGAKVPCLYTTNELSEKILFIDIGFTFGKKGEVTDLTGFVGN